MNDQIFREYDIRGHADKDLKTELIVLLGRAIGTFFHSESVSKIALACDCRQSADRLTKALKEGLLSTGLKITYVGKVPTPLLYFAVHHLKLDGGVMITGSHNPGDYNGFKMLTAKRPVYGEDIQKISQLIKTQKFQTGKGEFTQKEVEADYLKYCQTHLQHPLKIKVVVDSGNGMGGVIAPALYRNLGCEVIELFSEADGTFPNHHPDPTVLENLKDLEKKVLETKADVGIAFDGDADRIGVIDRTGEVVFGDELLMIYSRELLKKKPGSKIISEVKASNLLYQDIQAKGGIPIVWKTGHSLIKAKMKEVGATLAGEMSGHMFFADRYFGYDDAIYAGARLLEILSERKKTPRELLNDLPKTYKTPEIRLDCADEIKFKIVQKVTEDFKNLGLTVLDIDGARLEFADGWGLIRASNTQPVLVYRFEARTEKRLQEIRHLVESTVAKYL